MSKISVILLGYGNIGKAFVKRIEKRRNFFRAKFGLEIEFLLIVRSKKYCKNNEWFDFINGSDLLTETFLQYPDNKYIIVDCTATVDMIDMYFAVKGVKACIIAANKAPLAVDYCKYMRLQSHFRLNNISFFHEATVGAGLPIIKPLQALLDSGDTIHSIQGVLSGTLTYLFATDDQPFSSRLKNACDLGYTEPDPRIDLSGLDVARKCLVLSRMIGSSLSLCDVSIESLVPEGLEELSIDAFLKEFKLNDQVMLQRETAAKDNHRKLCYSGIISKSSIQVGLIDEDKGSDFSNLVGTDNLIQVRSEYYPQGYTIKGPGAGIEVTVNGLFSDFLDAILVQI